MHMYVPGEDDSRIRDSDECNRKTCKSSASQGPTTSERRVLYSRYNYFLTKNGGAGVVSTTATATTASLNQPHVIAVQLLSCQAATLSLLCAMSHSTGVTPFLVSHLPSSTRPWALR